MPYSCCNKLLKWKRYNSPHSHAFYNIIVMQSLLFFCDITVMQFYFTCRHISISAWKKHFKDPITHTHINISIKCMTNNKNLCSAIRKRKYISHASLLCANLNFTQSSSIRILLFVPTIEVCPTNHIARVALRSERDEKSQFTFPRAIRHVRNVLETPIESRACGETRNPTRECTFLGERVPERVQVSQDLRASPYI